MKSNDGYTISGGRTFCKFVDFRLFILYIFVFGLSASKMPLAFCHSFFGFCCWSRPWTHLYKLRRTHRRAVAAVVVAAAPLTPRPRPRRRLHHRHGRHHCHHHHHRGHRTLVCASGFVEVCPGYGPTTTYQRWVKKAKVIFDADNPNTNI